VTEQEERRRVVRALGAGGCVAPEAEADELFRAADEGVGSLDALLGRRLDGEPLAWVVGSSAFCDLRIHVDPGVFVPRPHTEAMARRAAALLPDDGLAVDLCTGSGAVAAVLAAARPAARVLATDLDPAAVACARRNGVDALLGDLDAPLPPALFGRADVVTAVVPYVPTEELHLLPRDVLAHEPRRALDGGPGGTIALLGAVGAAARLLRPGGCVLLEVGGAQAEAMTSALTDAGFAGMRVHRDDEGQDRAIEARRISRR
jgi:release factor glutamine methyltransferase